VYKSDPKSQINTLIVYTPPSGVYDTLRQTDIRNMEVDVVNILQSRPFVIDCPGEDLDNWLSKHKKDEEYLINQLFGINMEDINFFMFGGKGSSNFVRKILYYAYANRRVYYDRTGCGSSLAGLFRWYDSDREKKEQLRLIRTLV